MGMYTELIVGCNLKESTPPEVINTLLYMCGELDEKPDGYPFEDGRIDYLFRCSSYYFGVSDSSQYFKYDTNGKGWILSTRSSIKNYDGEIETFCLWLKPYVSSGSGDRNIYAMSMYEESDEYITYALD
jgi:hypothetical protein